MSRVLVIGDVHAPVTHPMYQKFILDLQDEWKTTTTHFIGDIIDWHGISFHAAHPECPGPDDEFALTYGCIQTWSQLFPQATVSIGNHDCRINRLAEANGIPSRFIRDYAETWDTPNWVWEDQTIIDDVLYTHGTGFSGQTPALRAAKNNAQSTVIGHTHSAGGVNWYVTPTFRAFGMDTGCGVDIEAAAMAYGRAFPKKPVLSAGVVLDGQPFHIAMPCGPGEKYHRSKARTKRG